MESMTVDYSGKYEFHAKVRGHEIVSDQPVAKHGEDHGPTPPELLIASLGSCIAIYAVFFAEKHPEISLAGMKVELEWERAEGPTRIGEISAKVTIPGGVPEHFRDALHRSMEACLIHNTLTHCPKVELTLS